MKKIILLACLTVVIILHGTDKIQVIKNDASSQFQEISNIKNLTFTNLESAWIKIQKKDGSDQCFDLSKIANLSFSGITNIESTDFFKKLEIGLVGNYPNPFNPSTTIKFCTNVSGFTKVEVFNQAGQLVSTLHNGILSAGDHSMQWNAQNTAAGTYFIRVSQNGETMSSKMLLIK